MIYRQKKSKNIKVASKTKINMKNYIRGVTFFVFWYLSILGGFFLFVCPILPLVIISPKRYRKWSDKIFGMWEPFPAAMMEVCFGIRVFLTGDKINPFETSLFVMNHRTRVDWSFLWLAMFHCCQPNAHNMKYVLKSPVMHLPGAGWVMQTCSFIFVYRNWIRDKPLLDTMIDYLNGSDNLYQILIFPEGTDLSENNIRKSHEFADENNLDRYYRVLHPRTTGFAFIANKMKTSGQLGAIYDVTIAYPKTIPLTESDLLRGKFPEEVHFNFKRYSSSNIPHEEEDLVIWLKNVWRDKEQKLERFYTTGSFSNDEESPSCCQYWQNGDPGQSQSPHLLATEGKTLQRDHVSSEEVYKSENYRPSHLLYVVLAFWISLSLLMLHQLVYNSYLQIWVLTHSLFFTLLSFVSNGFHQLAASFFIYRFNRKPSVVKKSE